MTQLRIANQPRNTLTALGLAAFTLVCLSVAADPRSGPGFRGWFITLGVVGIILAIQTVRSDIVVYDKTLVIHNLIRTYRLGWADVEALSIERGTNIAGLLVCVGVRRTNGSVIRAYGTNSFSRDLVIDYTNRILATSAGQSAFARKNAENPASTFSRQGAETLEKGTVIGELSKDGQAFWNGDRWAEALSTDGKWRWNGQRWATSGQETEVEQ
jgi:hypothetical protein